MGSPSTPLHLQCCSPPSPGQGRGVKFWGISIRPGPSPLVPRTEPCSAPPPLAPLFGVTKCPRKDTAMVHVYPDALLRSIPCASSLHPRFSQAAGTKTPEPWRFAGRPQPKVRMLKKLADPVVAQQLPLVHQVNVPSRCGKVLDPTPGTCGQGCLLETRYFIFNPPKMYTPQNLYPPRLKGRFAKICTPVSHVQANGTRTTPGYSFNTSANVTHLNNEAIVVWFLTLETPGGPWAAARNGPTQIKLNAKRKRTCSTAPPKIYTPPKFIPPWPH